MTPTIVTSLTDRIFKMSKLIVTSTTALSLKDDDAILMQ